MADGSPPDFPDAVRDGPDRRADAAWQSSRHRLTATWAVARDPESGLAAPHVCFGTSPGACDTRAFAPALLPHTAAFEAAAPLGAGPYYATVRQHNGAGLHTDRHSDGVRIDAEPPAFAPGAGVRLAGGGGAAAARALTAEWDAAADAGSGVVEYRVAVGLAPGASGLVEYFAVGLATHAAFTLPPHAPAFDFYVTVQARDAAGQTAHLRSAAFAYDATPPALDRVRVGLTAAPTDAFAPQVQPRVPAGDFHVSLAGAADPETGIARVRWWLESAGAAAPVTAAAVVADWRGGWRVQGLGVASGAYHLVVELRNGAGVTARYETPIDVAAAGPTIGRVWDGVGAVDTGFVPVGQPVGVTWRDVHDADAIITGASPSPLCVSRSRARPPGPGGRSAAAGVCVVLRRWLLLRG